MLRDETGAQALAVAVCPPGFQGEMEATAVFTVLFLQPFPSRSKNPSQLKTTVANGGGRLRSLICGEVS